MGSPGGPRRPAGRGWRREVLRGVAGIAVFLTLAYLARGWFGVVEARLADLGAWAPVVYVLAHVPLVSLGFPVSVLGLLAGATFGFWTGTAILTLAGLIAAAVMFVASRTLLAARVRGHVAERPRLLRFVTLAEADAWRIMVLLRLSPLHFGLVCYLLGASRVGFWPYLITSACVLPSAALQAYMGHAAEKLGRRAADAGGLEPLEVLPVAVGALAAVLLLVIMGRLARRALESSAGIVGNGKDGT